MIMRKVQGTSNLQVQLVQRGDYEVTTGMYEVRRGCANLVAT